MKNTNKLIIVIILIVIIGIILFSFTQLQQPTTSIQQEAPQPEETNLETYEEDFKEINNALNNID